MENVNVSFLAQKIVTYLTYITIFLPKIKEFLTAYDNLDKNIRPAESLRNLRDRASSFSH